MLRKIVAITACLVLLLGYAGCNPTADGLGGGPRGAVRIQFDKNEQEQLIAYYFGSFLKSGAVLSNVVSSTDRGHWLLKPDSNSTHPAVERVFEAAGSDSILTWGEFEPIITASYYDIREAPRSVDRLKTEVGDWSTAEWFSFELIGQMSPYKRKLAIKEADLLTALEGMRSSKDPILYSTGAAIIGEHRDEFEAIVETTVMVKREDGFWDYFAYDESGDLVNEIKKEPDPLSIPTNCTGCHFGDRAFEPEKSFPTAARPGPTGERAMFVPEEWMNRTITGILNEHTRRSDHILGLYATLYVSRLQSLRHNLKSTARHDAILNKLGIEAGAE